MPPVTSGEDKPEISGNDFNAGACIKTDRDLFDTCMRGTLTGDSSDSEDNSSDSEDSLGEDVGDRFFPHRLL